MQNTVADQDVGSDNPRLADEDGIVADGDGEVGSVSSSDVLAILQRGRVSDGAVDDVVSEDASERCVVEGADG